MDEDGMYVLRIDRDVGNFSFSWVEVFFVSNNIRLKF